MIPIRSLRERRSRGKEHQRHDDTESDSFQHTSLLFPYFLVERRAWRLYFRFPPRLLRAVFSAIATACFCGLPSSISVRMLLLTSSRLLPFFRGITDLLVSASPPVREPPLALLASTYRQ